MGTPLTIQDVITIVQNLACWLFNIAVTACMIFIIFSGIRYMAAGGNTERMGQAKRNFYQVLIGTLVIFGVTVIINTVAAAVGSSFTISLLCN